MLPLPSGLSLMSGLPAGEDAACGSACAHRMRPGSQSHHGDRSCVMGQVRRSGEPSARPRWVGKRHGVRSDPVFIACPWRWRNLPHRDPDGARPAAGAAPGQQRRARSGAPGGGLCPWCCPAGECQAVRDENGAGQDPGQRSQRRAGPEGRERDHGQEEAAARSHGAAHCRTVRTWPLPSLKLSRAATRARATRVPARAHSRARRMRRPEADYTDAGGPLTSGKSPTFKPFIARTGTATAPELADSGAG